eukprot:scaffold100714_cov48-Phaeocystis_antarctica.AAC.1
MAAAVDSQAPAPRPKWCLVPMCASGTRFLVAAGSAQNQHQMAANAARPCAGTRCGRPRERP